MTLWASCCSPSPTARVTPANSLVQPCMVPGHMTHQVTLQVAHIATRRNSDPYPSWFQGMCLTRLHCSLNMKLQNIDMLHTLHGSRTCDSPGHNAAKTDSYQTYMCSIPFEVPGHVSHYVTLQLEHIATKNDSVIIHCMVPGQCRSPGYTAAKSSSYQSYRCPITFMVQGHVTHLATLQLQHKATKYTIYSATPLFNGTQKTTPSCVVS